ncbi:MAG: hypothetical protein NTY77_01805 [Elusimicrobia bacterium]|nr:hypothetical protein [Elusimicrobiota bacterium]
MTRHARPAFVLAALALAASASGYEPVTITVSGIKDLNLRIYGFAEADYITDTTQGFNEVQGNFLVPTRTTFNGAKANYAGQHNRAQMSIRNTRLGFEFNLPKTQAGLQSQGLIELDLLGNDAPNTVPGATPGTQSESNFFNNPALRVRHAYMSLTYHQFNAKLGQTWSLLGWQPYYYPGETVVFGTPGQLFARFVQARLTHTLDLPGACTLESAADMARPAQMNSGSPEFHAGLRVASTKLKGASTSGAGTSMVGLSAAVSAALIPVRSALGNATGGAVAFDMFVPIIPSSDGKDRSNNLVWAGELMSGSGVGGVEYAGLTSGVPAVQAAAANGLPGAGTAIDAGIAGIDNGGALSLIRYRAFRTHLQYSLPGGKWAASTGYAQVETRNLGDFGFYATQAPGVTPALLAPKLQFGYASLFYDALSWLRFAGELNQTRVTYVDAANRFAVNNRVQLSAFFIF